jgi:hypothetical protein
MSRGRLPAAELAEQSIAAGQGHAAEDGPESPHVDRLASSVDYPGAPTQALTGVHVFPLDLDHQPESHTHTHILAAFPRTTLSAGLAPWPAERRMPAAPSTSGA